MLWARMLAYITGTVDQELLEGTLAEIAQRLGRNALEELAALLHDRDTKFSASFRELIESGSVKTICLPAKSPNLNSFAERRVRSLRELPFDGVDRQNVGQLLVFCEMATFAKPLVQLGSGIHRCCGGVAQGAVGTAHNEDFSIQQKRRRV